MYYKLYRRRQYIYFGAIIVAIIFLLSANRKSDSDDSDRRVKNFKKRNDAGRININTYVEPEPCKGCPGENGSPVYLNVRILLLNISRFSIVCCNLRFLNKLKF